MVQLSEEHIKEMYRCFMLLYVDEYDDDTLDSLGLDEVDDATRSPTDRSRALALAPLSPPATSPCRSTTPPSGSPR